MSKSWSLKKQNICWNVIWCDLMWYENENFALHFHGLHEVRILYFRPSLLPCFLFIFSFLFPSFLFLSFLILFLLFVFSASFHNRYMENFGQHDFHCIKQPPPPKQKWTDLQSTAIWPGVFIDMWELAGCCCWCSLVRVHRSRTSGQTQAGLAFQDLMSGWIHPESDNNNPP